MHDPSLCTENAFSPTVQSGLPSVESTQHILYIECSLARSQYSAVIMLIISLLGVKKIFVLMFFVPNNVMKYPTVLRKVCLQFYFPKLGIPILALFSIFFQYWHFFQHFSLKDGLIDRVIKYTHQVAFLVDSFRLKKKLCLLGASPPTFLVIVFATNC